MFPHGNAHLMRDAPGSRPVNIKTLLGSCDSSNWSFELRRRWSSHHSGLRLL